MTQTVYLFDPHGVDAKCLISNESRAVPALGGRFRCIIPSAAPFYRKGAVVKVGARVLKEGVDFYFGHQYIRGTHQTAQMIYGSILILDETVTTPVTLSYQTLGGQYTVTDARITQYLANELTDPIAASWESVMGNDLYFPPVDIAYDIDNWSGENELKAELSRIADAIRNQEPLESEEYDLYDRWLKEQRKIVDDSLWAEHLANQNSTTPGTGPVTPGPTDNTIVSLNLKQLVYDEVDYGLAAKFMLVTPRSPGFFPHFYSNGIESWSSMSAEAISQYIWTFADQDTAERVSSIYKDERGFWKQSFLDVRPGTGMVSGYQFTNYHAVWELCAGHMAPLPPYNSPDGQPVLIPGQYGSVELVLVHAPNKDGPMPAILLTITDTWFDDKQGAVITLQSYYREVTIFSQAISGALHYGTKFRVTVDLTDTPDMADGLWLPDALAVVVTAVYPDNHLTEVMNTTLTYADLGGLREHLYSNQGVHTGIAEYNAYNPTTKLIQFTFDTHSSNTTTGGEYVLDGGIINSRSVGFYLGQESNRPSWVWQYSETPNLDDPPYWGEEYMMTGRRGVILNSDISFLDSNTLFSDSTIPGYTGQYAGVYSEYIYGFFSLTTYVSGGAANVQLIEQIGQFTFDLGGNEPGIAAIVLKDDQAGPAGNQLSVIIDPYNVIGSGSISVWYNFRTDTETCLGFSNSFYNEPVSWDTLGEIKVVAKFLPAGIEVSVDYGVGYAQNKSLTVPMDSVTQVVALDQILLSNIGVGGMMQPRLCFADTVIEEYTYFYQQGTGPVIKPPVVTEGTNPHNTQWYEAGALKSDGVAQNADKLSNLTKDQLADYVNARQGVATTGLFPLTGNRILTGDLVLQDGLANLSRYAQDTGENESFLQLSTGNITLNGDRNVTIQADKDKNNPGTAATMEAGVNVLKVVSSGGALEKDKLLFNNQQVLTTETLKDHLPTDANATVNISYANGGGLTFSGKGSSVDPLKVNVSLPDGSLTKAGLMQLTSALDNSAPGTAATPYAIKKLNDQLADLVPTTRKINGYPLSANVRITTTNLGLDHVDNTTDAAKPVNGNHRALLNQYNVIVHEHTASDFSMNIATTAVAGLVIYSDVVSSDTTHALMSTAVSMLDTTADENDRYLYTKVPVTATDIVRYGDAGYLPIPVVGSYPAAGVNASSLSTVGEIEADGTLVCLRNGSDVSESGVYYTYATFNADGSIKKVTPTTTKYTPDYLPANDSMLWVTRGTEGVFVIRSLLGKHYIVLTNGTMESRYHVGSEITTSLTHGWQLMPIIVGQYVYLINHNYANTEYAFSAWRCLRSDIGKGPVAFTQLTFTGTDAFGNVQTAVTRFNLVPGGISTDPTAKIQAIDLSGGVWTTRNLRHANCNYDMAAEGNKVRVATYVSMYLANSSRSVWSHYSTGYVIDFDTMTATLDTPDGFPIKFDANGVITTSLRQGNESIGFPRASASNQTGVIRSRGKTIAYMFYGSEVIPNIGAFEYTVGTSEFDQLNTNTSQSVSIGSALYFNGNYGSVLGGNQRGIHLISGNRYVAYQADGTYVQAEYDLNSTYVVGDLGYGPTVNRKTITPAQHLAYTRTIHTVDAAGVAVNDGYVFSDNALSGPSKIIGETLTNTVSITATAFNALKANFFAQLGVGTPDATTRFINAKLSVYVATSPDYPTVAFYSYRVYSDDTLTASVVKYIIATVTLDSRSAITSAVLNAVIKSGTSSSAITFLNDPSQAYGGSTFAKLADGNVLLILQSHSNYGTVGGSALNAALLIYNPTTSTWIRSDTFGTAQYVATGYFYTKEQGIFSAWRHATGEAVMINRRGSTSAAFATGSSTTAIFTATRVATGWLIYFTEPVVYFCDGVKYTLPVQNLDVRTFFPGEYQNQTMYLYVTLIAGVPTYTMSLTHVEDTPTATYIGYCTTDSNKVTALSVERATRLGLFRELQAHLNDSDAHGTGSATLASIGLPLLENKAPHYELKTDLFGEVYNSWTRFSHWPTDYNTAAYPGEVNAWTFDASADTVRCTQNTVGYSGFVSLDAVGDFTFDTVVGVKPTSTDGDNDAITLVIAFKTEDGKQHDISVVRSRSIDAHIKVDTMFGVYYDYMGPEQTKIASVLTTTSESPGMWRGYYARIRVVRVGDNYTVLSTPVSNTVDWSAAIDSDFIFAINFTLNDLPALAKFKGPTRYGYGAVSQIDASYINYLRPDEDGRNYYATAIEAIKAADWQSRMSVTSGTVTNGGILPVPAGYDATECRWFLSPRLVNGTPPAGKGMMSYTMSYNASRVVTATSTYEDGTVVPNIVHYQCLAVKGIKLFK